MNELIIYLAGVVLNTICASIIFYKNGSMSVGGLSFALFIIIFSFAGTVAVIFTFLVYIFTEFITSKGDTILWKRKEVEK